MSEPNIVYVGDEVRHCSPAWDDVKGPAWVTCYEPRQAEPYKQLILTNKGGIPLAYCTTPDGRPVDGFGGARLELHSPGLCIGRNGIFVDCVDNYEEAIYCAKKLYGAWIEEPTRADLERRGLL